MSTNDLRFAIIGMGPRGLTVFERICANLSTSPSSPHLTAYLIDPTHVGTGTVWRINQAGHLLMNTVASQVTIFTDSSVEMAGPVAPGPSLYEWATYITKIGTGDALSDQVRAEARDMTPDSYPTRSFYGQYLRWAFEHIANRYRRNLTINEIDELAVDVVNSDDGKQTVVLEHGRHLDRLDAVVLTQGHLGLCPTPDSETHALTRHAEQHSLTYIPPQNAADADLSTIRAGEPVIARGLGLTFFDYMTLLTTGRGGAFTQTEYGLRYIPSEREPIIYAGSRRGVPYHSRGQNQKGIDGRHHPQLLTAERIEALQRRSLAEHDVSFRTDVWPLVAREVECVYYTVLVADRLSPRDIRDLKARYLAATTDNQRGAILAAFNIEDHLHWSWERVLNPVSGLRFADHAVFQQWIVSYLRRDVAHARQGNVHGAVKAALDVLRDLRNEVRLIVDHGGITGHSYRDDLDRWYTPSNAFLSIGPPMHKVEELIALIHSGVVRLIGPDTEFTATTSPAGYTAHSAVVPGSTVHATTMLEARLPEPDIRRTEDQLLQSLLNRGEARPYRLANPDGSNYETGGLDVAQRTHNMITADGTVHPRRFALGVPTESVRWVTAAGPRPGVNSVTLGDADCIARAILAYGQQRTQVNA